MLYYLVAIPLCSLAVWLMFRRRPWSVADLDPVVVSPERMRECEQWTRREAACLGPQRAIVRHAPQTAAERARQRAWLHGLEAGREQERGKKVVELARRRA